MSYGSYRLWQRNDRALRVGEPVRPSQLPRILVAGVAGFAVAAAALAILRFATR